MSGDLHLTDARPTDPVSLVVRRRIRPGREAEYEALLTEANALLARIPGHRGTGVVRPRPASRSTPCWPASTP
ncbi:antibiotic biosynthesis monooxygenase [Deinococcus aquaticus]|uniref:antibiotic biosynthesis monooxygenase n=1 Tax=Deinococcus aquaticus TaxID=328692 RepID=UPI0036105191